MRASVQRPKRLDPGLSRGGLTDPALRPLPLVPELKEKVWGGDRLAPGRPVGEAWLVADLDEGQTKDAAGTPLRTHLETLGAALSPLTLDGRYPLLVKIIDTAQDLSVQVHPDDAHARSTPGARSKDESWLILDAAEGASVLYGFLPDVTPAAFRAALDAHQPERCLARRLVHPGDVIRIAPGTIHAIGAGITLLEVQEPSDTTFRVWDYDRPGLDGRPRPLHVEPALACLDFAPAPAFVAPTPLAHAGDTAHTLLIDAPRYRIERLAPVTDVTGHLSGQGAVLIALDQTITLTPPGQPACPIAPGQAAVWPAGLSQCRLTSGGGQAILASAHPSPIWTFDA